MIQRRPQPRDIETLRVIGVEAASGLSRMFYVPPDAFRLYAETRGCDGNGYATAWDYGDGIRAFRDEVWSARPHLAPVERRDEYQAKFDAAVAARRDEAREHQEAVTATAW